MMRSDVASPRAFLLLETMLGVSIFAIGVLVLAKAMQNCLDAELYRRQDLLAQRVLENRMAEVNAGAVTLETAVTTRAEGRYEGITLSEWREATELKNEENVIVNGVYTAHLKVEWQGPRGLQSREITFYQYDPLAQ